MRKIDFHEPMLLAVTTLSVKKSNTGQTAVCPVLLE